MTGIEADDDESGLFTVAALAAEAERRLAHALASGDQEGVAQYRDLVRRGDRTRRAIAGRLAGLPPSLAGDAEASTALSALDAALGALGDVDSAAASIARDHIMRAWVALRSGRGHTPRRDE